MKNLRQTFQTDFDRIAVLAEERFNHNTHYHNFLLRQLPERCEKALEIGCGTGQFSRLLAHRAAQVLAIDLSPEMIRIARQSSRRYTNIDFQIADAVTTDFLSERFDCVVSIATLHHLPMPEMLAKCKAALKVNGVLLVLDLFEAQGVADFLVNAMAFPVSAALRLVKTGRLRPDQQTRKAWREHEKHDSYVTLEQVRHTCAEILPDAKVQRHLLWRYSIVWKKPPATPV